VVANKPRVKKIICKKLKKDHFVLAESPPTTISMVNNLARITHIISKLPFLQEKFPDHHFYSKTVSQNHQHNF
jgi:hypothetical protein